MCSKEKDLVGDHMEKGEARLCGELEANIKEDIRIERNS